MKNLLLAIVVVVAGVAAVGFYRGWFQVSTTDADHNPKVTITVDQDKVRDDERKLKEMGHSGNTPTDRTGGAEPRP